MNPLIRLRKATPLFLALFVLGSLALLPGAQAVSPPPDGGYPGGNTAEGQKALLSLTTGGFNTAVGFLSLGNDTAGEFNTAVGAGALFANVGDPSSFEGVDNTATGTAALFSNTTGSFNTANGAFALFSNTVGMTNTANGASALQNNTIGTHNTANGYFALASNTSGTGNTAIGQAALSDTTGSGNTALGAGAGNALTSGNNNIDIGADVIGVAGESNTIRIGANLDETQGASACHIGGIYNQVVDPGTASSMAIDATGKLGTTISSRRFKHDIKPMDTASEAILALKPVTFHYKSDTKNTPCFGLIAEEVAGVNPDLVVRNKNGEIWSVRYDQVNAMLLNEFLKEHRKVDTQEHKIEEQEATISELKKDLQTVVARLKEQAAQLQKVSAQVQANTPTSQMVVNP